MSVFPRNMLGLRPVDYALTPEMQEVLRMAPEAPHPLTTTLRPPASLSKVRDSSPPHKQIDTLKTNRQNCWYFALHLVCFFETASVKNKRTA